MLVSLNAYLLFATGLLVAPLLPGIINRTKAVYAGRRGAPLLQLYYDLARLLRKGAVYSRTTTWIFRAAPAVGLAAVVVALLLVPGFRTPAPAAFTGDLILMAYCLGLMRVCLVLAALDTGSSFEGMGASREVLFAALAEPILLLGLAVLSRLAGTVSLSTVVAGLMSPGIWEAGAPALLLLVVAFFVVLLAENARIPVDDPNTHLELTMIHEVMILDYSGPDLAFVLYGAALKLWLFAALVVNVALAWLGLTGVMGWVAFVLGIFAVAVIVGIVESIMARLSMLKVPQLLMGAGVLVALAAALAVRSGA